MTHPTRRTARLAPLTIASLLVLAQLGALLILAPVAQAGPVVTSVSPTTGSTNGGTSVTITGTGFVSGAHVCFTTSTCAAGSPATGISVSGTTSITVLSPPLAAGAVTIIVTNPDGQATTFTNAFTYVAATVPTVTAVSPGSGTANGGTDVTITGTNFVAGATVTIGGSKATVTSVTSTTIVAQTTGRTGGAATVDVVVDNPAPEGAQTVTLVGGFAYTTATTPTLTSLSVSSGSSNGGTTVTLTGTGFAPGALVTFGGTNAASVTFSSSTTLVVVTPSKVAGAATVLVTNPSGLDTSATPASYTFVAPAVGELPTVTAISPITGSTLGGTTATLTGTNFHTGSNAKPTITFGTGANCGTGTTTVLAADITVTSATSITIKTPATAAGAKDVCLSNPIGTGNAVAVPLAAAFTFVSPVRVNSLSVATGPSAGSTVVTFTGSGFAATPTAMFGGTAATLCTGAGAPTVGCLAPNLPTEVSFVTPPHAAGAVRVDFLNADGKGSSLANAFTYSASAAPTLTSLGTTTGSTNGGTPVTATGTNFQFTVGQTAAATAANPTVTVGGVAAIVCTDAGFAGATAVTGCLAPSGTALTFITPARTTDTAAANQAVVITNRDGQAVASDATDNSDDFDYTVAADPTVTLLSVATGSANGGTTVVITGTGFHTGANAKPTVTVGGTAVPAAAVTVTLSTSITIITPAHAAATAQQVKVTNPNTDASADNGALDDFAFTAATAPTLTSVSVATGAAIGGTLTVLQGSNFGPITTAGAPAITVGGTAATLCTALNTPVTGCDAPLATAIEVITPGHAAGLVSVVITNQDAQVSTLSNGYTYTASSAPSITSVSQATGSAAGGYFLTLTGTNFPGVAPGQIPSVTIGGTAATVCTAAGFSGTTVVTGCLAPTGTTGVTIQVPVHAAGTATLVLTNPDGQAASLGNAFRFVAAAPTLTSLSVSTGTANGATAVTLTGTGFDAAVKPTVLFGADTFLATVGTVTTTTVAVTTPAHAIGTLDVVAIDADGQTATLKSSFAYAFAQAPSFTSISPATGSMNGGTTVTVSGNGFASGATVTVDGVAATGVTAANGQVSFVTPNIIKTTNKKLGPVDVVITNPDAQALTLTSKYAYSTIVAPVVTSVSPTTGPTAGGTSITITGTNFGAGATATVGGTTCTSPVVTGTTQLVCTTPVGSAGAATVAVTFNGQTGSLASAFTYTGSNAPTITSITPATGPIAGGTAVTIVGTNFASGATVTFASSACTSIVVTGTTSIACTTPAHAAGAVTVTVTVSSQSATTSFTYTDSAASSSSSSSASSSSSSSSSTSTSPPAEVTATEIEDANKDVAVDVERVGDDNLVSFTLPDNLPADPAGVQVWRSNSPFVLVATLDDGDADFIDGDYLDVGAASDSKYLVTVYYGLTSALGFSSTGDSSQVPGFSNLGSGATLAGTGVSLWVWVLVGVLVVVVIVVVLVLVLRRRSAGAAKAEQQGYAWEEPAGEAAPAWQETANEEPAFDAGPSHPCRCPSCGTQFTVSGTKPIQTTCPGCGKKGILR